MKKSPKAKMDWFALKSSDFVKWAAAYLRRKNWPGSEAIIYPRSYSEITDDLVLCSIFKDYVTKSEESFTSEYRLISNMQNAWKSKAKQKKASRGKVRVNVCIQPELKARLEKFKEEIRANQLAEAIEELIRNIDGNKFIQSTNSYEKSKLLDEIHHLKEKNRILTDELERLKIRGDTLNHNEKIEEESSSNVNEKIFSNKPNYDLNFAKDIRNHRNKQ
ncbi:hypothetical protein WKI32_08490 [Vibrio alginolyticus]